MEAFLLEISSKQKEQGEPLFQKLRMCTNYREFLRTYLDARNLSLADWARLTGFGRGFPGEVLSGKRRLTAKSYYPFERAFKLPLQGKKFFYCLVAIEETDLFPYFDKTQAQELIQNLKLNPWDRSRRQIQELEQPNFQTLLKDQNILSIYAAAGDQKTGANFETIQARTQLPQLEISKLLAKLEAFGLLQKIDQNYYPKDLHLFLKTSDQSEILSSLFIKATDKARRRLVQASHLDNEFFFTSQFCIRMSRMPELKTALRETILKFVDDSIDVDGDRVAHLLMALHL